MGTCQHNTRTGAPAVLCPQSLVAVDMAIGEPGGERAGVDRHVAPGHLQYEHVTLGQS